jgi:predicted component of type VI protein secretion system
MFGGQDDNGSAPQSGGGAAPQDDTLNGVSDLVGGTPDPAAAGPAPKEDPTFMPAPSEPPQAAVPAPNEEAADVVSRAMDAGAPAADNDELLSLKQQALQQLTPLVGHLSQSAEEKFRTLMMLIQASDNEGLLKDAYEAAQSIEDEKVRAQALLDVVNEINYFTQNRS